MQADLDAGRLRYAFRRRVDSLIVEDGTALARRIRRGEMPGTVDDVLADRYDKRRVLMLTQAVMGVLALHRDLVPYAAETRQGVWTPRFIRTARSTSVGFLGLGAQPPSPEWGAMVAGGRRFLTEWRAQCR